MSDPLIQYAFISGELSGTLNARSDLEKYDLGLSLCYNFFVDYRGGISSRAGTRFIEYMVGPNVRLFKFAFSPDTANTYLLVVGNGFIRFVQDGGFIIEDDVTVTNVTGDIATATAHGYSTNNVVYLGDKLYKVGTTTANTFQLLTMWEASATDAVAGVANRVYTVSAPWAPEDLQRLVASQRRDEVIFTHPDYTPRRLVRNDSADWSLSNVSFTTRAASPGGLAITPSSAGSAGVVFAVTAVVDGEESLPTRALNTSTVDYTATAGHAKVTWNKQKADYFNIYRSIVLATGTQITYAQELGYVGRSYGPIFIDNNIIPDFTRSPPDFANPFGHGGISSITVTASGSGYSKTSTVSASGGGGSGFAGYPIVDDSGALLAVVITKPGSGYTSTPTISVSGGTGATFTVELGAASGNNPATSRIFQQRRVYGGTHNEPMTLWGSKIGQYGNFDASAVLIDSDAYEFTLDAELLAPIRHLIPMQGGLVIMSEGGIWQLHGTEGRAVSPSNALAEPQSYNGCSFVPPITIDTDIMYTQEKGAVVRALSYNDLAKVFAGTDVSTLSNHFFKGDGEIVRWTFAEEPFKLIWAARRNGGILSFTYVKEQEVYAWAQHWTNGTVIDVLNIEEDDLDAVYLVVERFLGGRWVTILERMEQRDVPYVDAYWGLDSALQTPRAYPAADLLPAAHTGTTTFRASAGVFSSGNVGDIIRAGAGKAEITAFTNTSQVTVVIERDFAFVPDGTAPLRHKSGSWTMDPEVSTLGGLYHLEGEEVSVLADGVVIEEQTVVDGEITLDTPASIVTVGLPFVCRARTLPLTASGAIIEDKRKRIVNVAARVHESRGIAFGSTEDNTYEVQEEDPTTISSGIKYIAIEPDYDTDSSITIVQRYPLPATILGLVPNIEVGDEDA